MDPHQLGYPATEGPIEVRRTHLSEVYLTPTRVLKRKRPVDVGFVDFRERSRRLEACEAEVRLNRRLAPDVYLGVRTLPDGEPAVEMRRLQDADALLAHFDAGTLTPAMLDAVARRVAEFHASAARSDAITQFGSFDVVLGNARDNYLQTTSMLGDVVHPDVHRRGLSATEATLHLHRHLLQDRAARGFVRDTHGDLRLEHVYWVDGSVIIIDCIEFSDRFRYSDIAMDLAFLTMDLGVRGAHTLADGLWRAWAEATQDDEAAALRNVFESYRSAVRGKVAGLTLGSPLGDSRRATLRQRARRHFLFAWDVLAPPTERPLLVGVGGRPGTGKTTVARTLGEAMGFEVIRTDVVRKALAGLSAVTSASAPFGGGLYGLKDRSRVYDACFEQAEAALFAGKRVIVDASFTRDAWRLALLDLAAKAGVPAVLLWCDAPDAIVETRIAARSGDASDADVSVFRATPFEPPSARVLPFVHRIDTGDTRGAALHAAIAALPASHAVVL